MIDQAAETLLSALLYLGGGSAAVGAIYLAVSTWMFLAHLPRLGRGE